MKLLDILKSSPLLLVVPSLLVALVAGAVVLRYEPLVFDPSLYPAQEAQAKELTTIDADALESDAAADVSMDSVTGGALKDGMWTGYAPCGQGNPDDWKPYYVAVTIKVEGGKVTGITNISGTSTARSGSSPLNWDASENQKYLDWAIAGRGSAGVKAQIESQIAATGSATGIDTISGATYSSAAIYNAYVDAVRQAGGQASALGTAAEPNAVSSTAGNASKHVGGSSAAPALLADGAWTGYAVCGQGNEDDWKPYYVAVTVRVKDGKVVSIERIGGSSTGGAGNALLHWDASENQKYLNWAIDGRNGQAGVKSQMSSQLASGGSVSGIDTISGATFSSEAIYAAYQDALSKSAAAAGARSGATSSLSGNTGTADSGTGKDNSSSETGQNGDGKRKSDKVTADDDGKVSEGTFADGEWTGLAACGVGNDEDWKPYYVSVTVKVKDGKLKRIVSFTGTSKGGKGQPKLNWDEAENRAYLNWAATGRTRGGVFYEGVVNQMKAAIDKGETPQSIDTVSGATYSSTALFEAFYEALKKSAKAGGAVVEVPDTPTPKDDSSDDQPEGEADAESGSDAGANDASSTDSGNDSSTKPSDTPSSDDGADADGGNESGDSGNADGGSNSGDTGTSDTPGDSGGTSDEPTSEPHLVDGIYEGHAFCKDLDSPKTYSPYYIVVKIEVKDGKIAGIADMYGDETGEVDKRFKYDSKENSTYLDFAINGIRRRFVGLKDQIQAKIDAGEAVEGIDVVSGATWSSKSILEAYASAEKKALQTLTTD